MNIIKHAGKYYRQVDLNDLSKEELLEVIHKTIKEVPEKEIVRKTFDGNEIMKKIQEERENKEKIKDLFPSTPRPYRGDPMPIVPYQPDKNPLTGQPWIYPNYPVITCYC